MLNRRPVHPESPRTASFGPEQGTHTKHTMNTGTPTDLELLQITGSLRGRQRRHSGFAAGRNRAGYLDTLSYMQNKPNFRNAKMNINSYLTKAYGNIPPAEKCENKPNQTQFQKLRLCWLLSPRLRGKILLLIFLTSAHKKC